MGWVTFTQRAPTGDSSSTVEVSFNTDNISAVTQCNKNGPNAPRTLIEVVSGKDFWVQEEHLVVMQSIAAAREKR